MATEENIGPGLKNTKFDQIGEGLLAILGTHKEDDALTTTDEMTGPITDEETAGLGARPVENQHMDSVCNISRLTMKSVQKLRRMRWQHRGPSGQ